MNIRPYLTKKYLIGTAAAVAIVAGGSSCLSCLACKQAPKSPQITPQQTLGGQAPIQSQPASLPSATQPTTLPETVEEDKEPTLETKVQLPQLMYIEIGNRHEHKDLYNELSDALLNGISRKVLENSYKKSGFKVTHYKGNKNVVVNKHGIAQAVFHTDSHGITSILTPTRFSGYPDSPDIWDLQLEPRSELAEGYKAEGNPIDISDKAYDLH